MFWPFGGKQQERKRITAEFADKIKGTIKPVICPFCNKNLATKVVFGQGVQPSFTCNNCEFKAVGGTINKLSQHNLISIQKFASILTAQMTAYQSTKQEPPLPAKQCSQKAGQVQKSAKEQSQKIKVQLQMLKDNCKKKGQELVGEADRQNTVLVFEEVLKVVQQKRQIGSEQWNSMVRRSLVDARGVHFVDEKAVQLSRAQVEKRMGALRKECKLKLREVDTLIQEINSIQI